MKKCHKILLLFVLMSMVIGLAGCSRGPSKKEIEQLIRESIGVKAGYFPYFALFPREEYLDARYILQEETLKIEELRIIKVEKARDEDLWRVQVHVKVSGTLAPKPAPGASWLRAYDHYEAPTSSKRIVGEGEHEHYIRRDSFGKLFVQF